MPFSLTDSQLQAVLSAAADLPQEKRSLFLERISAMLNMRGCGHFTDADVVDVASLALCGLKVKANRAGEALHPTIEHTS